MAACSAALLSVCCRGGWLWGGLAFRCLALAGAAAQRPVWHADACRVGTLWRHWRLWHAAVWLHHQHFAQEQGQEMMWLGDQLLAGGRRRVPAHPSTKDKSVASCLWPLCPTAEVVVLCMLWPASSIAALPLPLFIGPGAADCGAIAPTQQPPNTCPILRPWTKQPKAQHAQNLSAITHCSS